MMKTKVNPVHSIVCSGRACVCRKEGTAFLSHTKDAIWAIGGPGETVNHNTKISGLDNWNIGGIIC